MKNNNQAHLQLATDQIIERLKYPPGFGLRATERSAVAALDSGNHQSGNPKLEIRNPKQIPISKEKGAKPRSRLSGRLVFFH